MELNTRCARWNASWGAITSLPRAKMIGVIVAVIVPGGFLVPLCYAAYVVIRRSLSQ